MKSEHQKRIEKFMKLTGNQNVPKKPEIPDLDTRILRAKLIFEEAIETIIKGLGLNIWMTNSFIFTDGKKLHYDEKDIVFIENNHVNMEEIVDGCADLSVVTIGTLSACGIHDMEIIEAVDKANLKKFGLGSYRREDGKWIKPQDWQKPDLISIIENQKNEEDILSE